MFYSSVATKFNNNTQLGRFARIRRTNDNYLLIYVYILNHLAYRIFEIQLILFDWEEKWERKRERNKSCVNGNPLGPYISFKTQERAGDTPHTVLYNIAKRKQRGSNVFVIFWQTTTPFSPFIILQGWNWSMTLKLHVEIL